MELWLIVVVVVVVVAILAAAGVAAVLGAGYMTKRREAAELARYLQGDNCKWERMLSTNGNPGEDERRFLYRNTGTESSGIDMRVYFFPPGPEGSEEDGICLSIIDPRNSNGLILNGFHHELGAMQFGDEIWNEKFLGDAGIMEQVITEKRTEWDQMQREIIVAHYSMFM